MAHLLLIAGASLFALSVGGRAVLRRVNLRSPSQNLISKYKNAFEDPMSRKEAALILGVKINSSEDEIMKAYRILISRNHPDKGGSSFMAMKINQAKDIMTLK